MNYIKSWILRKTELIIRRNFLLSLKIYKLYIFLKALRKTKTNNSIAFVNTFSHNGGAATVAHSIFSKVKDSYLAKYYVRYLTKKESDIIEINKPSYSFFEEVLRRESILKGWIEFSGFHITELLNDSFFRAASVVHLHNLHGEFFSPFLFSSLLKNKTVIWTLHDESFFTGHCSCTLGCDRWKIGCGNCPDLTIYPPIQTDNTYNVLQYKKKNILSLDPIVICPSKWLANKVKIAYPELKRIKVIPNGVDVTIFKPMDQNMSRQIINLPLNKQIILFVAEFSTKNPFKGGEIIQGLISDKDLQDYLFITIGGDDEINFSNHLTFPYIQNQNELAILYSCCDVLLYPTRADNLPMVVLEAMSCETVVIASNLGGLPEIIQDNYNGILVEDYQNVSAFKKCLIEFLAKSDLERKHFKHRCRTKILSDFTDTLMIENYMKLYALSPK